MRVGKLTPGVLYVHERAIAEVAERGDKGVDRCRALFGISNLCPSHARTAVGRLLATT